MKVPNIEATWEDKLWKNKNYQNMCFDDDLEEKSNYEDLEDNLIIFQNDKE